MRVLLLVLLACSAFGYFAITPDPPQLGETRWEIEARWGRSLTSQEYLWRYDIPTCSCCMTRDCPDVTYGLYAGRRVVYYDPQGRVFLAEGSYRPWVCPDKSHECGWKAGWWEKI